MRKIMNIFVLVAAAAIALVSCNKQEVDAPTPQEKEYEYIFEVADGVKAAIGENSVVWEDGDQIGVYTDGQNGVSYNRYGDIKLGSPVTFTVSSYYALLAGDMVHCYYPYVSSNSQDPRTVNLSIPTSQTEKNQMPMVSLPYAVTENLAEKTDSEKSAGEIRFANLGSVIEFHVYSTTEAYQTELVKSVTFNADQAIAGDFTFDITAVDYSNEETLEISGYEATTVVSSLSTPVEIPAAKEDAKVVKMVVAPGTYAGNVVVTTDKATYTFPITTAKEFKRSSVKLLGLNLREDVREENAVEPEPEVETTVTFDFTSSAELTSWGITLPDPGAGTNVTTLTKGQVTMLADGGSTKTRVWNSSGSYDLRVYKGATLTFSVPSGYVITDVKLAGSATTSISASVMPSNPVVLTVDANAETRKISTITVKYVEGEVEMVPLEMTTVSCTNPAPNSLTFTWEEVTGAEGYKVSLDGGSTYGDAQTETAYTWEDLEPETEYTLYVKAIGNGVNTSDSDAVSCTAKTDAEPVGVEEVELVVDLTTQGYSNQQEVSSVSKNPIEVVFNKGSNSNAPKYYESGTAVRLYGGGYFTVSSDKTIVKVVITFGSSDGTNAITTDSGAYTNGTWTGNANSVKFSIGGTSGNRRIQKITVTYQKAVGEVILAPRDLKFSSSEVSATMGQAFTAPKLSGVTSDVKYTSSNTDVATVDATTGDVTLVAVGTTTITASAPATAEYEAGEVSYNLNVHEASATQEYTYTWTASSGALGTTTNGTVTKTLSNVSWTIQRSGNGYTGWTSNVIQIGKNGAAESMTLKTSGIEGTIKSVSVECSSYQAKHNVSISVGGVSYVSSKATSSWTTVGTVTGEGTASGEIEIKFTAGSSARAMYIKSIKVVYEN